ncbi:unnamed protein product [Closterium sp. NIES-54]
MHNGSSWANRLRAPASVLIAVFYGATLDSRSAAALAHRRPAVLHSGSVTVLHRTTLRLSFYLVTVALGMLELPLIRLLAPHPSTKMYPFLHMLRLFVFPSATTVPTAFVSAAAVSAAAVPAAGSGVGIKRGMLGARLLQQS